jgi:hypothetical protein
MPPVPAELSAWAADTLLAALAGSLLLGGRQLLEERRGGPVRPPGGAAAGAAAARAMAEEQTRRLVRVANAATRGAGRVGALAAVFYGGQLLSGVARGRWDYEATAHGGAAAGALLGATRECRLWLCCRVRCVTRRHSPTARSPLSQCDPAPALARASAPPSSAPRSARPRACPRACCRIASPRCCRRSTRSGDAARRCRPKRSPPGGGRPRRGPRITGSTAKTPSPRCSRRSKRGSPRGGAPRAAARRRRCRRRRRGGGSGREEAPIEECEIFIESQKKLTGPVSFPMDLERGRKCVGTRTRARPSQSFPPVITSAGTQTAPPSVPGPAQPPRAMAMRQALAALQRSAAPWATARAACAGSRVVRPSRSPHARARRLIPPDLLRPPPPPPARSLGPPRPPARRRARPRPRPRSTRSPSRSGGGRPRSAASSAPRCAARRWSRRPPRDLGARRSRDLATSRARARARAPLNCLFHPHPCFLLSSLNPSTPTHRPSARRPRTRAPGSGAPRTTWSSTRSARCGGRARARVLMGSSIAVPCYCAPMGPPAAAPLPLIPIPPTLLTAPSLRPPALHDRPR